MGSARLILLLTKARALRRVAVVTGGTRGIGRGISEALAEHDFDLLVSYNSDAAAAEQAAAELKDKYRCAVECVGGDVSLPETRAKIWETFDKVYGATHALGAVVHNAGQYVGVTSTNAAGNKSPEPGAFGAAWTASTWPVALAHGVKELWHWSMFDTVKDFHGREWDLLYGWGWLYALGELLVGGDARALATTERVMHDDDVTSVLGLLTPGTHSNRTSFHPWQIQQLLE